MDRLDNKHPSLSLSLSPPACVVRDRLELLLRRARFALHNTQLAVLLNFETGLSKEILEFVQKKNRWHT
jgi:hypothetical protein